MVSPVTPEEKVLNAFILSKGPMTLIQFKNAVSLKSWHTSLTMKAFYGLIDQERIVLWFDRDQRHTLYCLASLMTELELCH